MNIELQIQRFDDAIAVMQRADVNSSLCMLEWQDFEGYACVKTEEELHKCGNTACFAGHVAVSPEFRAAGGSVEQFGGPRFLEKYSGTDAISEWLGITKIESASLILGDLDDNDGEFDHECFSNYYNKMWVDVHAKDVIEKLEKLKTKYQTGANYLESQS